MESRTSSKITRHLATSTWMMVVLVLLAAFLPEIAMAQAAGTPSFGSVSSDDLSKKILIDYLFGPLTGAGDSPLTGVIKILNAAVLFLGGVFMMYSIIAGTMATAHDGEILGRKWSAMWLPIRTALGAAAVMPVIGGGWCAAQAVVVWLATLGISIANAAWTQYTSSNLMGNAFYNPPVMDTQIHQLLSQMLLDSVCVASYEAANTESTTQSSLAQTILGPDAEYGSYVSGATNQIVYSDKDTFDQIDAGAPGAVAICGTISIPHVAGGTSPQNQSNGTALGSALSALNMQSVYAQLLPVQRQAVMGARTKMASLAAEIVKVDSSNKAQVTNDVVTTLDTETADIANQLSTAAKQAAASSVNQNFMQEIAKDGWINAGSFYMAIALAQDQITNAVTTLPAVAMPYSQAIQDSATDSEHWWQKVADFFGAGTPSLVKDSMANAIAMLQASTLKTTGGVQMMTASAASSNGNGSWADKLVAVFTTSSSPLRSMLSSQSAGGTQFNSLNQDPIITASNMGNAMLGWADGAFIAMLLLSAGATAVSYVVPGITSVFLVLMVPFGTIYSLLFVSGATMSFYLPMMPYILWLGVVFGWAVLLVEAVVAAPLWAVVHLAPDADGVVGRGGQGYMLVLSLTLRPVLMIIGLVCAIALMRPVGFLLNSTFGGAFSVATQGTAGLLGVLKAVAGCVIYAGVMVSLAHRVFALIHVIPDRMLRWIGGGGNELGQEATATEGMSSAKAVAAVGAVREGGAIGREMGSQTANMGIASGQKKQAELGARQGQLNTIGDRAHAAAERADNDAGRAMSPNATAAEKVKARRSAEEAYSSALGAARQSSGVEGGMKGMGFTDAQQVKSGGLSASDRARASDFAQRYDEAAAAGPGAMEKFTMDEGAKAEERQKSNPGSMLPHDEHMLAAKRQLENSKVQQMNDPDIPPPRGGGSGGGSSGGNGGTPSGGGGNDTSAPFQGGAGSEGGSGGDMPAGRSGGQDAEARQAAQ